MTAGLHRIMGSRFTHLKPTLCPNCAFYQAHPTWDGVCGATGKLLSAPTNAKKHKCASFEKRQP